ncbi:MAG: hypothetical protein HUK22_00290, partial [Thermoguttaceae bacterium]|nr:hypothetical protein [Thermoguttaceae bacterium]
MTRFHMPTARALAVCGAALFLTFCNYVGVSTFAAEEERLAHPQFTNVSRAEVEAAFENLRPAPRLLLTDEAMARARASIKESPRMQKYYEALKARMDKYLTAEPLKRELEGKRLLGVSRHAIERVYGLSFLYKYLGDETYARRVEKELLAIADFQDWNPSHFLDVAEMSVAVAIGCDSCGEVFEAANREKILSALKTKGLDECFKSKHWWQNTANWNQVCWCGTLFAGLTLAESAPDAAKEAIWRAVNGVTWSMSSYEPDGNYTEGPGYWGYGTSFNIMLIEALNSALGQDFGRSDANGLLRSIQYYEHVFGTTGLAFNYPDSGGGMMFEPTAFWYAHKLGAPNVAFNEIALLEGGRGPSSLVGHRLAVD